MKKIQLFNQFCLCSCLLVSMSMTAMSANRSSNNENDNNHHSSEPSQSGQSLPIDALVCEQRVNAKVNGLVCDFCARALEKVFSKQQAVAGISVDLDEGMIDIQFKPNQSIDEDTLTQLITDSGYNVVSYHRGCTDG